MRIAFRFVCTLAVACSLAEAQGPCTAAFSGSRAAIDGAVQEPADDPVSGVWGIDFPSGFYFRGLRIEDRGLIAQPYLELSYGLHSGEAEDAVRSVALTFGVWNSLHEGPSGTGGGNSMWFEGDFYTTLSCGLGEHWSTSGTYIWYASPNGSFAVAEEATLQLAYADASLWGGDFSGLNPSLTVGFEVAGQADGGSDRGTYGQLAIEPNVPLGKTGELDWTLALPFAVGFSLGDYYENPTSGSDEALGFVDVGAAASTPLPLPGRFGPWTMSLSVHVLLLGDTPEQVNRNDDIEVIAALGLSTVF